MAQVYTSVDARGHRRRGDREPAAVRGLQRARARRAGDRRRRATRTVRDDQDLAALDSAPLLRRPFSIFEILRDAAGASSRHLDSQQTRRRRHHAAVARRRRARGCRCSARSAGRSNLSIRRRKHGWWPAASGWRRSSRSRRPSRRAGRPTTLFYGARRADELYCVDLFEALGVRIVLTTEDGSRRRSRTDHRAARGRAARPSARTARQALRLRPDADDARLRARSPRAHGRACDVSLEQVMGCGLGGCYSCVVPAARGGRRARRITPASCIEGPVFDAQRIVWDAVAGH